MRILMVDDDDDVVESVGDLIRLDGSHCVGLHSLSELVQRRDEALACDLAILDVNLGRDQPSGLDAFAWLRAEGFAGRVVFLTGHAIGHPFVERACSMSGAQVLQKPIMLGELRTLTAAQAASTVS
jgi:DNA-binding response OmpR family regulator